MITVTTPGSTQNGAPLSAQPSSGQPPEGADVNYQAVILAAGMGTRLGKQPWPKPLTPLADGRSIMRQQLDNLQQVFGEQLRVLIVVGFKLESILEAFPDVSYAYNESFDQTNTNRSLLKALRQVSDGGVLWLNGDVVFDPMVLERAKTLIDADQSFVCVNTAAVAEEEVKYTIDSNGFIDALSKQVNPALGEAVGINYISRTDRAALIRGLEACQDSDYFERGIEISIEKESLQVLPLDITEYFVVEIDFAEDLSRANKHL